MPIFPMFSMEVQTFANWASRAGVAWVIGCMWSPGKFSMAHSSKPNESMNFFHPQQLEVIEHALVAEVGTVDDDVRDAHLLGELQVFFAKCVEAELETEFHGGFPF